MKNKLLSQGSFGFHAVPLLFLVICFAGVQHARSQYFDPPMDDQVYLDNIQKDVQLEVKTTKAELMEQATIIQGVTRRYIGAKLKENIFKALRILAEKELETISMQERPRQPRQEEETEEEGEDGGAAAGGVDATTRRGLIPQLALILKAIFGGGQNSLNATRYVQSASAFLPKPLGNQLVGVVSLLDRNNRNPTTVAPTTAPYVVAVNNGSSNVLQILPAIGRKSAEEPATTQNVITSTRKLIAAISDDDEDESIKRARQLQPLNILGTVFKGLRNMNATTTKVGTTTESLSGFEEETATQPTKVSIAALMDGVKDQIEELRYNIPDIFQGAREAYKLLESVSGLFERFGAAINI